MVHIYILIYGGRRKIHYKTNTNGENQNKIISGQLAAEAGTNKRHDLVKAGLHWSSCMIFVDEIIQSELNQIPFTQFINTEHHIIDVIQSVSRL